MTRVVLRVPSELKRQLEAVKRRQHVSINQQAQQALEQWLAAKQAKPKGAK